MIETLLVNRYQLIEPLGEGGFAKTYLAADSQRHQQRCVIKHLTLSEPSPQALATARRLFKAEADVLRRLGRHDRIPTLIDAFEVEGEFYLVQEFIDGASLSDRFQAQSTYTEAQMIELLEEMLPILEFIHSEQVIHRDIKPSNLMLRRSDGKPVLIDFGAVKEITTQFHTAGSEQFTISIGTQGYAAPEQMAGRPRFSSDLYALGMTVIRGLTGRSPTALPENPHTGELLWQAELPAVSPGLVVFLQRLTHVSVYQRYASASEALADLRQLDALAVPPALAVPQTLLTMTEAPPRSRFTPRWRSAIAPLLVTAIVLAIRQLGGWVPFELWAYDRLLQYQPAQPPDDRLLLVEVTETDLQELQRSTPSDATLNQVIQTLQAHQPRVIGLDLYREIPQGEGHAELLESLKADNIIAIRKLGNLPTEAIPAPATVPPERAGFNDFPIDGDGVVRRTLLFAAPSNVADAEVPYAFSLRLALAYLQAENIQPLTSDINPDYMDLNGTTFVPLNSHFGGYQNQDDRGYQLMLQYRAATQAVERLSLGDVLKGQFTAAMIRDRIVVIGTTAPSAKDLFFTPFSAALEKDFLMPGVLLHVHATSQLLSAALDGQQPVWALPEGVEIAWIVLGALGGGVLGGLVRRPWRLLLFFIGGGAVVVAVPIVVFVLGGWLPLWPASVAFLGATVGSVLFRSFAPSPAPIKENAFLEIAPKTLPMGENNRSA